MAHLQLWDADYWTKIRQEGYSVAQAKLSVTAQPLSRLSARAAQVCNRRMRATRQWRCCATAAQLCNRRCDVACLQLVRDSRSTAVQPYDLGTADTRPIQGGTALRSWRKGDKITARRHSIGASRHVRVGDETLEPRDCCAVVQEELSSAIFARLQ